MTDSEGIYYSCRKCMANSVATSGSDGKKYCICFNGFIKQDDGTCKKP